MARKAQTINLSEEERTELLSRSRSLTLGNRHVTRARIILDWADNKTIKETSRSRSLSPKGVIKWRRRFLAKRIEGLKDAPRPGQKIKIKPETRIKVIELASSKPEKGYSNWSQRRLAQELGISQSQVCRILKQAEIKPHKTDYWCGKSTDPEFEQKMLNIVGLYLSPPKNALVLCVDEKTQMQALDRTQPELPLRPGNPKRLTTTYKRHGTVSLIAALAVHTGDITAKAIKKNDSTTFLAFLKKLYRDNPGKELHVIVDNLSVHKEKTVTEWVDKRKRLTLHFTPTYSSWLNQIEIWFSILTKDVLKDAVWHSRQQMVKQIMQYIKTYNHERAKPFQWTYTGKPLTI